MEWDRCTGGARGCELRSRRRGRAGVDVASRVEAGSATVGGFKRCGPVAWPAWMVCVISTVVCWGCSSGVRHAPGGVPRPGAVEAQPAAVRPMDASVGKIVRVHAGLRFVVVDFGLSEPPKAGMRLGVYREGARVGALKAGHFRRETTLAADVVSGVVAEGDEARPEIAD